MRHCSPTSLASLPGRCTSATPNPDPMTPNLPATWRRFGALSLFALTVAAPGLLRAQEAAPAAAAKPDATAVELETYTVTEKQKGGFKAERVQVGSFRDMNPVDVPVTVNVVSREVLDAQGARSIYDALKNTAGVTRANSNGNAADNIAIRGITVENRGNYRLNGSLPVINLIDLTLENKERVEVLKGGASLYYGFVPPSGIVNLVTKRATPKPLTAFLVTANNYGGVTGQVDISRSFGEKDQVGVRINAAAGQEDIGIDHHSGMRRFGSIAVDWKASDRLLFRFDAETLRKNTVEQTNIRYVAAGGIIPLLPMPPQERNLGGDWQENKGYMRSYVLRTDVLLSRSWTIVAEAGTAVTHRSRHSSDFRNYNLTTGAGQVVTTFNPSMYYSNDNARVELFGRFLLAKMQHNLSIGYAYNERAAPAYNNGNVTQTQNYFNPVALPRPTSPTATTVLTDNTIEDIGKYVFDRVVMFDERLQLIGGVRYADYDSRNIVTTTNNTTGVSTAVTTLYNVKNKVAPMASLAYKPTPKTSVYFSYTRALEPGATAPTTAANPGFVLPPLESRQFEVGAKADFRGILFQVSYFDIERPSAFTNAANFLTANGVATYQGTEVFITGEAGEHVSLIASGTMLDAEQTNAANTATFGKIPEGTAKYTGSFFAEWRVPQIKGLNVSAGAYYIGKRPLDNSNLGFVGGFTTFSAGVSYVFKVSDNPVTVRLNADNFSNKNAWAGIGGSLMSALAPRLVKGSVSVRF
jgi:iron complex outermembrane receptor protein